MSIELFDPLICDFTPGGIMVEASAGTGKTYNIQEIFLRLILDYEYPADKILVVTFTEAATAELQKRIRTLLTEALAFFTGGPVPEKELDRMRRIRAFCEWKNIPEEKIISLLSDGVKAFDDCRIFTIHGFCRRVLSDNTFESGSPFEMNIEPDSGKIFREILFDFCRRILFSTDENAECRRILAGDLFPDHLFKRLKTAMSRPGIIIPYPENFEAADLESLVCDAVSAFKDAVSFFDPEACDQCLDMLDKRYRDKINKLRTGTDLKTFSTDSLEIFLLCTKEKIEKKVLKANHGAFDEFAQNKKNADFFNACSRLETAVGKYRTVFPFKALRYLKEKYAALRKNENFFSYDDLIADVCAASRKEELVRVIREKYSAAIIDEFQDTDDMQYEIFSNFFGSSGTHPFIMVGDPKQAIYSFRGGDLATYRRADRERLMRGGAKYSLSTNFRSTRAVIDSVNILFGQHGNAFSDRSIVFTESMVPENNTAVPGTNHDEKPLAVVSDENAEEKDLLLCCAQDICALLNDPEASLPGSGHAGVLPADIAVLSYKNDNLEVIRKKLSSYGIPCVCTHDGSVYASPAAEAMLLLLQSVREPGKTSLMTALLKTEFFSMSFRDICREFRVYGTSSGGLINELTDFFSDLSVIWEKRSFLEMFEKFLFQYSVRERILQQCAGERFLTDLLHLRDLLSAKKISPASLISFLEKKIKNTSESAEEEKTLLETDRSSVKLMTIHKSKGLQFPCVFLPDLYVLKSSSSGDCYHDDQDRLCFNLDQADSNGKQKSMEERSQENLRLAYVALTRAEFCSRVYFGKTDGNTALDWLFRKREKPLPEEWSVQKKVFSGEQYIPQAEERKLILKEAPLALDENWVITSFSGLMPQNARTDSTAEDYDGEDNPLKIESPEGPFILPAGKQTGNAWHEILEKIDFESPEKDFEKLLPETLRAFGLCRPSEDGHDLFREETEKMIRNLLSSPLTDAAGNCFSLSGISREHRLSELEFHYHFKHGFGIGSIFPVIEKYLPEFGGISAADRKIGNGFLNGIIDLVFEYNGRYYIVDWKSNSIGGDVDNFDKDGLRKEMKKHAYFLQYLIYILALYKFLKMRGIINSKEDYGKRMGDVFYCFLRGIGAGARGIYSTYVPFELVLELNEVIG